MNQRSSYDDQPLMAVLYDLVPVYNQRSDIAFYVECCRECKGRILELGCGTGRITIPIAESGHDITGLDASPNMLAELRKKLLMKPRELQTRVNTVEGNMVNFALTEIFDLVIIPFRAFQHVLTVADQLSCLRCIRRHLRPGGRLIFDVFQVNFKYLANPQVTEEHEDFAEYALADGRSIRRTSRLAALHRAEQINDVEMTYYFKNPDGISERIVQAFPMRYFFRFEVEHLLIRCGFRVAAPYGAFNKSPLADDSPEMIFVAEQIESAS